MPDPNFTITSGKVLNITGSKNHIISSVGVCYYIQVILEESATNPERHEHLFMCMACFVSSVRSSNSHSDLLVIHHPTTFSDHTGPQHWTFTF